MEKIRIMTPHKVKGSDFVIFYAKSKQCSKCDRTMIAKVKECYGKEFFHGYHDYSQDAQMKRAGLVYLGKAKVDDEYICEICEKEGKADFICSICEKRHDTCEIKEQIGDPAEFMCKSCYETVPAKEWDDKLSELQDEHRWDFD